MRKVLSLILILTMVAFSGCGTQKEIAMVPETEKAKELETVVENEVVESTIAQTVSGEAFNNSSDKELIEIGNTNQNSKAVVYFTKDITANSLVKVYEKLGWTPTGNVGVKISTGEPPRSNYLRADLIGDLVKKVNGTIVECNTAYGGERASTALHKQVAADHGYTSIANVDIMDEEGDLEIPINGGKRINHLITGTHIKNYDSIIVLSHFKGHQMAGYGGAIKNVGIGMSSSAGKVLVHTAGERTTGGIWYDDQDAWLEALAEMVKGMSDYYDNGKKMTYINVMNKLSIDCDCNGNPAEPDIHDIGILASNDPVALDQACLDLVYKADGRESLVNRINGQHGEHTLEHAVEIGLGTREYELVSID